MFPARISGFLSVRREESTTATLFRPQFLGQGVRIVFALEVLML